MQADIERWNKKFAQREVADAPTPDSDLVDSSWLPAKGRALDIASGSGQNAVYLAQLGLQVTAIDGSSNGMQLAMELASRCDVSIKPIVADLDHYILEGQFDLIIVFHYLNRPLLGTLPAHLNRGGVLICKTFNQDFLQQRPGFNPEYVLKRDELPTIFQKLEILQHEQSPEHAPGKSLLVARKN